MTAVLICAQLLAGPDPAKVLADVDAAANRAKDALLTLDVAVSTRGSEPLQRTLRVWQSGAQHRMVKFLQPARLRGTGILATGGQTWLYTRAYNRTRRIAGKAGGGSFMGTGFSINDLARVRFTGDYTAEITASVGPDWDLKLTPVDSAAHDHAFLRLTVRAADKLVKRIETVGKDGKVVRTIAADDFRAVGRYTIAHRIVVDEVQAQKVTTAVVTKALFDTGLTVRDFTQRQLERAP